MEKNLVPQRNDPPDALRSQLLDAALRAVNSCEALHDPAQPAAGNEEVSSFEAFFEMAAAVIAHSRGAARNAGTVALLQALSKEANGMRQELSRVGNPALDLSPIRQSLDALCGAADEYACLVPEPASAFEDVASWTDLLLVVDDDPANCELLARRLQREGYRTLIASSGAQAVRMISRYDCDLVLLDLQMPGMSGVETLREIRGSAIHAQLPVIMVTAEDDVDVVARCIEAGADDYLVKPPQAILLKARVHALLTRKHLQDEQERQRRELEVAAISMRQQAEQMEKLLENILPRSVALELQNHGAVQPMYFEDVSIVFADIVGFTLSTEKLPADDLVESLNEYFTACDKIMARYRLEKLKTIGDSYMFAGGIPEHNSSHPVDSIFAAMEMVGALETVSAARSLPWKLRIGMHVGPVIAGVVGIHKFAFDIWGEAVNHASRVESCGAAGRVNLSLAAFVRVKDFFACERREPIHTKDGRECEMYFVEGIAEGLKLKQPLTPAEAFGNRYSRYFRKPLACFPAYLFDDPKADPHSPEGDRLA